MSLILDALRKMEQERKSRRGSQVDLRPEVLRYRAEVKPQRKKPYLAAAAGAVLVAAGIAAVLHFKGEHNSVTANAPVSAASPAPVASPVAVPVPAAPPAVPAPVVTSQPSPAVAVVPAVPQPAPAVPQPAPAAPVQVARRHAAPAPSNGARKPAPLATTASSVRPEVAASPEVLQSPPDIAISGIAWQEERRMRRAVVNGALVAEGAEVAGSRVVEIKENKVRFSRGGQIFDVLFSSALSSH